MFIGHFTEQPWQDEKMMGRPFYRGAGVWATQNWNPSNREYDPEIGRQLYNRYLDEKLYAEEMGFDGLMLNEHHSAPFCMQSVTNVGAAILARQTKRAKIVILGNLIANWEDPLWLAEQLAMIDMISHGRLVPGIVRGSGRESIPHNQNPVYNRQWWQETHDFLIKTWTTPGPFRWEGNHLQYRYVNPWALPLQKPHPPIWVPGIASMETVQWSARHHYPYIMLATQLDATKQMFEAYHETAAEAGYKSGTQNVGYLFKVHVEETEELAEEAGRRYLNGVINPFLAGNVANANTGQSPWIDQPPGISSPDARRRRFQLLGRASAPSHGGATQLPPTRRGYEEQVANYGIVSGTPKSVMPRIRHVLETLRPGSVFFWDGDGGMTHDDQMRSFKLMGDE
ncbi:MAG: LLM class flavin-dependent oxidoreductase, partial [SAR202 cluster bacterium]|nr:LLM class flavin-dependent oxidoreductase [SAR202 cluster bacterium]